MKQKSCHYLEAFLQLQLLMNQKKSLKENWNHMDGNSACYNGSDRGRSAVTCMEHRSTRVDCRNRSYMEAVKLYLGDRSQIVCGIFAEESLYGCGIAYTITSASSISIREVNSSMIGKWKTPLRGEITNIFLDLWDIRNQSLLIDSFKLNHLINVVTTNALPHLDEIKLHLGYKVATLSWYYYAHKNASCEVKWKNQLGSEGMESNTLLNWQMAASDDDGHPLRTGTLWSCVAHIITAVISSGVLSLAWSAAQLGWIAGPVSFLCFAIVTYVSAFLLSNCYRSPDPVTGTRNYSYMHAVRVNSCDSSGKTQTWFCGLLQYLSLYGTGVACVITTSTSMRAIQRSNCYHREGHKASCEYGDTIYMLLFGAVQIVMSQIPDFHNMQWLSVIAAIMSFTYSFIGFGLGVAKVIENGSIKGSITGVSASSTANKLWLAFQALGDIAFAYPYSIILLEIQVSLLLF
ncbi:hypothetical protein OIU76_018890 [Salix suchowensis]|nr:hypothetical protein OIU76_018890 [Salix suchowensis]